MKRLALTLAALSLSAPARAHAPPQATGIAWPTGPSRSSAVVRTNRGLIFQEPSAGTFSILCAEAFGSTVTEVAPFTFAGDGTLFVASYDGGLQRASADRCSFEPVTELRGAYVADLQSGGDVSFSLALPLDGSDAALFSREGAREEWSSSSSFEGAPDSVRIGDGKHVYVVSMRSDGERQIADVLASADGGATFSRTSLTLEAQEIRAWLLSAGSGEGARVFLRTQTADGVAPERLLLSEDGGVTFRATLSAQGPLSLASTAAGDTVWVGAFEGLFRSTDGGLGFTRVAGAPERIGCLALHDGLLYACGYAQGEFGVLTSNDPVAEPFTWFLRFPDVRARLRCGAGSSEERSCRYPFEDWAAEQLTEGPSVTAADSSSAAARDGSCGLQAPREDGAARHLLVLFALARRLRLRRSAPEASPERH